MLCGETRQFEMKAESLWGSCCASGLAHGCIAAKRTEQPNFICTTSHTLTYRADHIRIKGTHTRTAPEPLVLPHGKRNDPRSPPVPQVFVGPLAFRPAAMLRGGVLRCVSLSVPGARVCANFHENANDFETLTRRAERCNVQRRRALYG